ncbi:hypothetical protein [Rhizobium halophytocola]|uniref:Uncharacterized protein n=1 Tax=Rhizobium halophytocola TaxID=735519 RepID=A0ABS4E2C0_9HYPH|nr:hypothetical protein [Rhizobium halophytocola]MBP1852095.1 hypothetical protein [Rhizobium halophytocola]
MALLEENRKERLLQLLTNLERRVSHLVDALPELDSLRREILSEADSNMPGPVVLDIEDSLAEFEKKIAKSPVSITTVISSFLPELEGVGWYPGSERNGERRAWSGSMRTATLILPIDQSTIWCRLRGRFATAEQAATAQVLFSLNGRGVPSVCRISAHSFEYWIDLSTTESLSELAISQDKFVKDAEGKNSDRLLGLRLDEVTVFKQLK